MTDISSSSSTLQAPSSPPTALPPPLLSPSNPIPPSPTTTTTDASLALQLAAIEARLTEEFALSLSKAKKEMEKKLRESFKLEIKKEVKKQLASSTWSAGAKGEAAEKKKAERAEKRKEKEAAAAAADEEDGFTTQQQAGRWPTVKGKPGDSFAGYKMKKRGAAGAGGGGGGGLKRGFVPAKNMFAALKREGEESGQSEAEGPKEKVVPVERKKLVLAPRSKPAEREEIKGGAEQEMQAVNDGVADADVAGGGEGGEKNVQEAEATGSLV